MRRPDPAAGRAGFTLIEVLIVVTIIGILATIVTSKVSALRAYATAQEVYAADQGRYGNLSDLQSAPHNFTLSRGTTGMGRGGMRAWYLELSHTGVSDPRTDVCHMSLGTGNPDEGRPVCDQERCDDATRAALGGPDLRALPGPGASDPRHRATAPARVISSRCGWSSAASCSRVLDVAAGNGNATLAAARRWCDVTSTDFVPSLLAHGRRRADAEGLPVSFEEADAEDLPYPDHTFDAVLSTFGVMFTPDQEKAAKELARVCRPGGKIGLANWTPESFVGQVFRTLGRYIPPAAGTRSPALWGTRGRLEELFDAKATALQVARRSFIFRYRSPQHWLEVFRAYYGPMFKAYATLDPAGQEALTKDLLELMARGNRSGDGTLVLPSEYLEVVVEVA